MKRLTKIYEDCEGFIRAVAFEDEKAVNIIQTNNFEGRCLQ